MRTLLLLLIIIGTVVTWYSLQEYRVGSKASATPASVDLADLEAGEPLPDYHIRLGRNHCMYAYSVIEYEGKGEMKQSSKVHWVYTPVISDKHPYMQELRELERRYGGLERIPDDAEPPRLGTFVVLLKSAGFASVKEVPEGRMAYEALTGVVTNEVDPLDAKAKRLIRQGIPEIDFDKVYIVENSRNPTSVPGAIAAIAAGAALTAVSLGLLAVSLMRRKPRLPGGKPADGAQPTPGAGPPAPPPTAPGAASLPQVDDKNPYRPT